MTTAGFTSSTWGRAAIGFVLFAAGYYTSSLLVPAKTSPDVAVPAAAPSQAASSAIQR